MRDPKKLGPSARVAVLCNYGDSRMSQNGWACFFQAFQLPSSRCRGYRCAPTAIESTSAGRGCSPDALLISSPQLRGTRYQNQRRLGESSKTDTPSHLSRPSPSGGWLPSASTAIIWSSRRNRVRIYSRTKTARLRAREMRSAALPVVAYPSTINGDLPKDPAHEVTSPSMRLFPAGDRFSP